MTKYTLKLFVNTFFTRSVLFFEQCVNHILPIPVNVACNQWQQFHQFYSEYHQHGLILKIQKIHWVLPVFIKIENVYWHAVIFIVHLVKIKTEPDKDSSHFHSLHKVPTDCWHAIASLHSSIPLLQTLRCFYWFIPWICHGQYWTPLVATSVMFFSWMFHYNRQHKNFWQTTLEFYFQPAAVGFIKAAKSAWHQRLTTHPT